MKIEYIEYGSKEYKESLKIRDEVLRIPWNRSILEDDLSLEKSTDILIGGFIKNKLEGVIVLHPLNDEKIQIKYLAIYEENRGLGIGKSLVLESENYSIKNNYIKIVLESRDTALKFYEKLGYTVIGKPFLPDFVPIIHIPMEKKIK